MAVVYNRHEADLNCVTAPLNEHKKSISYSVKSELFLINISFSILHRKSLIFIDFIDGVSFIVVPTPRFLSQKTRTWGEVNWVAGIARFRFYLTLKYPERKCFLFVNKWFV